MLYKLRAFCLDRSSDLYRSERVHSKYGNIYRPKGEAQKFVEISEDIEILASWGEKQFLKSGSFLNISNKEDIYGIAKEEFLKTYIRV